jgi:molybdopterin molybdotransferase
MPSVISVEEALRIITSSVTPGPIEEIDVEEGRGRVLARDLVADVDWPPFDTSAMDGYAIRLADVASPGRPLPERAVAVTAGDSPPAPLSAGEAVRVMTGAPLPRGTEAVIPVEQARCERGSVVFDATAAPGAHIRRRGESVAAGSTLAAAGCRLSASQVALAALAGADPLPVFRRPTIAIAATGNELVSPSQKPGPGQLRDSNGPMLLSLCRAGGWPARLVPRVTDDEGSIERLFETAVSDSHLLLTSGGVSAGDLDLLPDVARRCGLEILFHGVAVQPGRPIVFARRAGAFWFGLPGNPVSSAVGFHLFVHPALDRLEGDARPGAPSVTAGLTKPLKARESRELYRDARLWVEGGKSFVEPLTTRGSHDIATHARANALIRVPIGSGPLPEGAIVECLVIGEVEGFPVAADPPTNRSGACS